jgi:predicted membrane metal-binding protein
MKWLNAVILGDMDQLPYDLHLAVRATGLHHLLVISGIHLTMVSHLAYFAIGWIPAICYSFRVISAGLWLETQAVIRLLIASISFIYFFTVGCPPNAERALISTLTFNLSRVFVGSPPLLKQLQFMLVLQSLLFPVGFIGEANVIGWGAYLLLAHARLIYGFDKQHGLKALIVTQVKMCTLGSAVFGELNLLPILFMPALMPVFTCLLTLTGISFLLPEPLPVKVFINQLHLALQWLLFLLQAAVDKFPWLSNSSDCLPLWFRPVALTVAVIFLLNTIKTIRTLEHLS